MYLTIVHIKTKWENSIANSVTSICASFPFFPQLDPKRQVSKFRPDTRPQRLLWTMDSKTSTQGLWLHWYTLDLDSCFAQNLIARVAKSLKARLPGSKQEIGALTDSRKCRTFLSSPTLILYFLIGQIIDSASRKELVCTPKKGEGVSKMKIIYVRGGLWCPIKR